MGRGINLMRVKLKSRTEFEKILLEKGLQHREVSLKIGMCKDYLSAVLNKGNISYYASCQVAEVLGVPWDTIFEYADKTAQEVKDSSFTPEEFRLLKEMLAEYKDKKEHRRKNKVKG